VYLRQLPNLVPGNLAHPYWPGFVPPQSADCPTVSCRTPIMGPWCRRKACTFPAIRRSSTLSPAKRVWPHHGCSPNFSAGCPDARMLRTTTIVQSRNRRWRTTCSAVVEARRSCGVGQDDVECRSDAGLWCRSLGQPSSPSRLRNPGGPLSASRSTRHHNVRLGSRRRPVPAMA
jgi:hypothetical protein